MSHEPAEARRATAAELRGTVIGLVLVFAAGACTSTPLPPSGGGTSPSPSLQATPGEVPTPSASPQETGSTASVPPLLLGIPKGANQGVWLLQRGGRNRLTLPAGLWMPTAGQRSLALASEGGTSEIIHVGHLSGREFITEWQAPLPTGKEWSPQPVACISAAGKIVVADGGETLFLLSRAGALEAIPQQKSNFGSCSWLDEDHLIWDQEDGQMAVWDLVSGTVTASGLPLPGRSPSAAGTTFAYCGSLEVKFGPFTLRDGLPTFTPPPGAIAVSSIRASLSPDGSWMLVEDETGAGATLFQLAPGPVRQGHVDLEDGASLSWVPDSSQ